jgi:hypothetical protein
MTYVLLMVLSLTTTWPRIIPIVQTRDAQACEEAKKIMRTATEHSAGASFVCVPGVLVMPMDSPNAD